MDLRRADAILRRGAGGAERSVEGARAARIPGDDVCASRCEAGANMEGFGRYGDLVTTLVYGTGGRKFVAASGGLLRRERIDLVGCGYVDSGEDRRQEIAG